MFWTRAKQTDKSCFEFRIVNTVKDHINGGVHNCKKAGSWIKIDGSDLFNPIILLRQGWNVPAKWVTKVKDKNKTQWHFYHFLKFLISMLYFNFLIIFYNSGKGRGAYSLSAFEYSSSSSLITTGSGFDQGQNKRTKVVLNSGL